MGAEQKVAVITGASQGIEAEFERGVRSGECGAGTGGSGLKFGRLRAAIQSG